MGRFLATAPISLTNIPHTTVTDFVRIGFTFLSIIIGVISVVMIIYSGFLYVTSSGDANNVTKAKNTLMYAIIGLVIASLAAAIVNFALGGLGL